MKWVNYLEEIKSLDLYRHIGKVKKINGLLVETTGLSVNIGDMCLIKNKHHGVKNVFAQVIGQDQGTAILMPFGDLHGIGINAEVERIEGALKIGVGNEMLGHVIDPLGNTLQGSSSINIESRISAKGTSHNPLARTRITSYLTTGIRAIDAFMPIGLGQRIGIFSGSGVGKSTLLGMIAKNSLADINVIALIGERGREVNDFVQKTLTPDALAKSVIVVATADQPTLLRELAAHTATSIAEYFSNKNKNVLLIMDSVTRFAMARREIGLSMGEPATARGYTPSTFTELPKLIERAGNFTGKGSITGIYTVLVEGDDLNEPVADHMRAVLDGHIVLSRKLANQGHYPAIEVLKSVSRIATDIWSKSEKEIVSSVLKLLDVRERYLDVVEIGAYKSGANPELDRALFLYPKIQAFLTQGDESPPARDALFKQLTTILNS
ncbi:ATPase FliI/YscN family [Methylophilaceae bacterium 11]|nr:ATPase FliI/YscN family [Methylophilaceae bacterium 11]